MYAGVDLRLGRPVAVKVFRPGTEPEMEERFTQEALLLARLRHPGLVTVYDMGRHDGSAYLVMQLVPGRTLRDRATAPLPLREVTRLGAALADALAHVHDAGIVHRDVKPANILLDTGGSPYLTDFGISQLVGTTAHTSTGTLVGTAAYMAPEQVTGEGRDRPRTSTLSAWSCWSASRAVWSTTAPRWRRPSPACTARRCSPAPCRRTWPPSSGR